MYFHLFIKILSLVTSYDYKNKVKLKKYSMYLNNLLTCQNLKAIIINNLMTEEISKRHLTFGDEYKGRHLI